MHHLQPPQLPDAKALDLSQASQSQQDLAETSVQPEYQDISASFISILPEAPSIAASRPNSHRPQLVVRGVPVQRQDTHNFRIINREQIVTRRLLWSYRTITKRFLCVSMSALVPLFTIMALAISGYQTYNSSCHKLSLSLLILTVATGCCVIVNIFGLYAMYKKSKNMLRIYTGGLFTVIFLVFLSPLYLLFPGSSAFDCDDIMPNVSKIIGAVIGIVVFLILSLYVGSKLLKLLQGAR